MKIEQLIEKYLGEGVEINEKSTPAQREANQKRKEMAVKIRDKIKKEMAKGKKANKEKIKAMRIQVKKLTFQM